MATVQTNIARTYSDLDLNFTIHPVRKDVNKHIGEKAVINSVKNLILTAHYERPFRPEIGSNLRRMLFENMDILTAASIEREITLTISNFEPRARVSKIQAIPDFDKNGYTVTMEFYVLNLTTPITINFFLERIR
jgi:phage baseplate assembly protein W